MTQQMRLYAVAAPQNDVNRRALLYIVTIGGCSDKWILPALCFSVCHASGRAEIIIVIVMPSLRQQSEQ